MAGSFTATIEGWSEKAIRNADLVVKQSAQDVGRAMTKPKDGLVRGAAFEEGIVPVDSGELINSVIVQVEGATTGRGAGDQPPDFAAALAGIETGQTILIGFTADHARAIEYGFNPGDDTDTDYEGDNAVPGRFMVRLAVQQWQAIVATNAAKLKD